MKLSVNMFMTLDGVVQGPGAPDEDTSGGFTRGGWVASHFDDALGRFVDGYFQQAEALLYGRLTYQIMAAFWPQVTDTDDGVAVPLNTLPKYVVSNTLTEATWNNSSIISGDFLAAIRDLKKQPGKELQLHGCAQLARTLHDAGLIDVYRIMVFPVVVGDGKRLFAAQGPATGFRTVSSETTSTGVTALTLEPVPYATAGFTVVDGKEQIKEQ
ncbi:dihydrofolate reductase family protein [Cryptosporangium sp. NPDC048952]|uniref:dihydrofolate reductase family protein n=1 Tax=Cryptosporangium sp. NPDC048952 TaxID=3363961 RepID=UPI003716D583